MNNKKFTYEKSGVNITAADKFVDFLSKKQNKVKINQNLKILGFWLNIRNTKKI